MKRDDGALYALAMLMLVLLALYAATASGANGNTELAENKTRQEEQVISEVTPEEMPETSQQEEPQQETAKNETPLEQETGIKPEEQELSPEEIWQQETDYLMGHIYGQVTYDFYVATKNKHELLSNDIPENAYREYIGAAETLLKEAMENSEISDKTIERYNAATANISADDYRKLTQESIISMQGFQEAIEYYSYLKAVRNLFFSKDITEEQYNAYYEEVEYYEDDGTGEVGMITHETVTKRIEYSKWFLAEHGKENIPIPYFD